MNTHQKKANANLTHNALWDLANDPAVDSKLLCQLVEKYFAAPTYGLHSLPWETSDSPLFYKPYGACGSVTGSTHFVYVAPYDKYVVVDCGSYQGEAELRHLSSPWNYPVKPEQVHAILFTHAHLDHVGELTGWLASGFTGKVYCTRPTAEMMSIRLGRELERVPSPTAGPHERAVNLAGRLVCPDDDRDYRFGTFLPIEGLPGVSFAFMPNGHLLGSVSIQIRAEIPGRPFADVHFSGDVGLAIAGAKHGGLFATRHAWATKARTIVCESTNGDRPDREPSCLDGQVRRQKLADAISAANARGPGATLIISAFNLGRATDLLADLAVVLKTMRADMCLLPEDGEPTITLCSYLAGSFAKVVGQGILAEGPAGAPRWRNPDGALLQLVGAAGIAQFLDRDAAEAPRIDAFTKVYWTKEPVRAKGLTIIIAGSGTTTEGKIVELIAEHADDERAMLLLTGYCPEGSLGAQLRAMAELNQEERAALAPLVFPKPNRGDLGFGDLAAGAVRLQVRDLSAYYSGHADAQGLVDYVQSVSPAEPGADVILVHGTESARQALAARLLQLTDDEEDGDRLLHAVYCPSSASPWYDLAYHRWARVDAGELRSSWVVTPTHEDGSPRTLISVAKAIRRILQQKHDLNCSEVVFADGEEVRSFVAADGPRRHAVTVQRVSGGRTEIRVSSLIGQCDTRQELAERLFPWSDVLTHLTDEKVGGYTPISSWEEVKGLLGRIEDPQRRVPIFLVAKPQNDLWPAQFLAKRLALGAGEVYLLTGEGRKHLAMHGFQMGPTQGLMFAVGRTEVAEKLFFAQPHDQAPRLVQVLNAAEDHRRGERRPTPNA